jgi:DNA-binding transcriptional ArsR family regulator
MKKTDVLAALAAIAQETRLDIYRLLVQAGEGGLPAGKIGEELGLPSATLTFHLKELKHADLVTFTREGRSLIYSAVYPTMNALLGYLTENCCQGNRGEQPFVLRVVGADGTTRIVEARAIIDASGTWTSPNPAGADGLPAIGEGAVSDRITRGIPDVLGRDRDRYAGKRVAVVGSGHSALNALIEIAELREETRGTEILWIMRKDRIETAFGGEGDDALPERGALGSQARTLVESGSVDVVTPFRISAISRTDAGRLFIEGEHAGTPRRLVADELIVATGFRPDLSMLREIRLGLDPWLESAAGIGPLIDPNLHSCGTVRPHGANELAHPEPNFFIAGMKSYGRAPTFLLATGHEQVRSSVS